MEINVFYCEHANNNIMLQSGSHNKYFMLDTYACWFILFFVNKRFFIHWSVQLPHKLLFKHCLKLSLSIKYDELVPLLV